MTGASLTAATLIERVASRLLNATSLTTNDTVLAKVLGSLLLLA